MTVNPPTHPTVCDDLDNLHLVVFHFSESPHYSARMSGGVGPREIITHAQRVCRLYKKVGPGAVLQYDPWLSRPTGPRSTGPTPGTCSASTPA